MKFYTFISVLLFAWMTLVVIAGDASPGVVTQGDFAGMLDAYLTQAKDNDAYAKLDADFASSNLTQTNISAAIEHLTDIGLFPYGGWKADQPMRAHDMTSLVVRLHGAQGRVNIAHTDECMAYTQSVGCTISPISKVLRYLWENRPPQSVAPCDIGNQK